MYSGGPTPLPSFPASRTSTPSNLNPNAGQQGVPQTKICVYCGAAPGNDPAHIEAARDLARVMHENNIALVYGGGTVGLMGEVAKTLVALSGPEAVHGIIPEALIKYERDPTYKSTKGNLAIPEEAVYGRTTIVKDMHTRKQMMAQEVIAGGPGSGFVALPGGYGTLEELLETATWNQLGIHNKGVCVYNVKGFYDGILQWIQNSAREGFIKGSNAGILVQAANGEGVLRALREYKVSESQMKLVWGNE